MIDLTNFNAKLDDLIAALGKSGNQTADYFRNLRSKIQNISNDNDLKQVLTDISKIGTIAQYGDFSPQEDRILTALLEEAKSLGS